MHQSRCQNNIRFISKIFYKKLSKNLALKSKMFGRGGLYTTTLQRFIFMFVMVC